MARRQAKGRSRLVRCVQGDGAQWRGGCILVLHGNLCLQVCRKSRGATLNAPLDFSQDPPCRVGLVVCGWGAVSGASFVESLLWCHYPR